MDNLIKKAQSGDMAAFEKIVIEYQSIIYNTAYKISSNTEDAYDISQESLLKIYKNIKYFEGKSKFSTWVYRIVTNTALDYIKKHRKGNVVSLNAEMGKMEIHILIISKIIHLLRKICLNQKKQKNWFIRHLTN